MTALTSRIGAAQNDPGGIPVSRDYIVTLAGRPVAVYAMPTRDGQPFSKGRPCSPYDGTPLRQPAYFACAEITRPATVTVEVAFLTADKIRSVTVHPLARGIAARRERNRVTFETDAPGPLTLLVNGDRQNRPLHLFFTPPAEKPPADAIVFKPGFHDLGYDKPIVLKSGQTLYLAPGAWVEGLVRARDADNIRITGRGVLSQRRPASAADYAGGATAPAGIALENCRDATIDGITLTRGIGGWCALAVNCDRVAVRNFHILAAVVWSTDGFNPCNSRDVLIERCFIRTGDDCIAIKGNTGGSVLTSPGVPPQSQPPVENIAICNCVFWGHNNQVVVIGAETRARHFRNIRVSDCDVIHHDSGGNKLGVLGILPLHGTEIFLSVTSDIPPGKE